MSIPCRGRRRTAIRCTADRRHSTARMVGFGKSSEAGESIAPTILLTVIITFRGFEGRSRAMLNEAGGKIGRNNCAVAKPFLREAYRDHRSTRGRRVSIKICYCMQGCLEGVSDV